MGKKKLYWSCYNKATKRNQHGANNHKPNALSTNSRSSDRLMAGGGAVRGEKSWGERTDWGSHLCQFNPDLGLRDMVKKSILQLISRILRLRKYSQLVELVLFYFWITILIFTEKLCIVMPFCHIFYRYQIIATSGNLDIAHIAISVILQLIEQPYPDC